MLRDRYVIGHDGGEKCENDEQSDHGVLGSGVLLTGGEVVSGDCGEEGDDDEKSDHFVCLLDCFWPPLSARELP